MDYGKYRDGGTIYFKNFPFHPKIKFEQEVCWDRRIGIDTNEWYLGYPSKGRLLTEEEKEFAVNEVISYLQKEYERSKNAFETVYDNNLRYTFKAHFEKVFLLSMMAGNTAEYKSKDDFIIFCEGNTCTLNSPETDNLFVGNIRDCFDFYKNNT